MVEREALGQQRRPQHQRVQIGTVIGQEHQRIVLVEFANLLQLGSIDVDVVGAREVGAERAPHLDGAARLGGDHFVQDPVHATLDLGYVLADLLGEFRHTVAKFLLIRHVLDDEARNLVLGPDHVAFCAIERQARLPVNERGKGVGPGAIEPTLEVAECGRFADEDRRVLGIVVLDPPLPRFRRHRVAARREQAPHDAAALALSERHPQRNQQRILGETADMIGELKRGFTGEHNGRWS